MARRGRRENRDTGLHVTIVDTARRMSARDRARLLASFGFSKLEELELYVADAEAQTAELAARATDDTPMHYDAGERPDAANLAAGVRVSGGRRGRRG